MVMLDKKATGIGRLSVQARWQISWGIQSAWSQELGKGTKVWIGFDLDYADTRD